MAFTDELESSIQNAYLAILKKKYPGVSGKVLNCDSYRKIAEEIKSVIFDGQNGGLAVLEIANNIIYKILIVKLFKYENHEMATLIGYIYLKRQGVAIKNYSMGSINNNSTLDDIRSVTASW